MVASAGRVTAMTVVQIQVQPDMCKVCYMPVGLHSGPVMLEAGCTGQADCTWLDVHP